MGERFLIRRALLLVPLLWVVGFARDANSYLAIEGDHLRVRFGWHFNERFPIAAIESVAPTRWPWYYGLGWRGNFNGTIGLVASFQGVVEIRFREDMRVAMLPFLMVRCDRLAVSLEEPEQFMAKLSQSIQ
jgi:hypothetical protein